MATSYSQIASRNQQIRAEYYANPSQRCWNELSSKYGLSVWTIRRILYDKNYTPKRVANGKVTEKPTTKTRRNFQQVTYKYKPRKAETPNPVVRVQVDQKRLQRALENARQRSQ